jgi:predicted metal-binding protein
MTDRLCEECGLPIAICNAVTMVRQAVEAHGVDAVFAALTRDAMALEAKEPSHD